MHDSFLNFGTDKYAVDTTEKAAQKPATGSSQQPKRLAINEPPIPHKKKAPATEKNATIHRDIGNNSLYFSAGGHMPKRIATF